MENKQEKRFTVQIELKMLISVSVSAADEQDAQAYAMDILKDELCAPGNSDLYFCEIDDSDVYVEYADADAVNVYEGERQM